jgi:hypothetical protein
MSGQAGPPRVPAGWHPASGPPLPFGNGVIGFLVAGRRQEIGVFVALEVARWHVLALVLGRSVRLSLTGLALGVAAALSRFVTTFLRGVTATDPATYTATSHTDAWHGPGTLEGTCCRSSVSRFASCGCLRGSRPSS